LLATARTEVAADVKDIDDLVARAMQGNSPAMSVLINAGSLLGRALANVVNILDPKLILISGEGVRMGELFFSGLRSAFHKNVMPGLAEDTEIRVTPWGDDVWARAAASVVIGEIFNSPIQKEEAAEKAR